MKIQQIAALLGGAVVMALAGPAGAGTLYNTTAVGVNGTIGSYDVQIYEDSIFNFHVNSVSSNLLANTHNVDQVRIYFYTGLNGTGGVAGQITSAPTLTGGTNSAVWTNWGTGHVSGTFTQFTGNGGTAILGAGGNKFAEQAGGYFLPANGKAKSYVVELQYGGTNTTYVSTVNITDFSTPEASTVALLLPGLVPLGIALRRRRATRQ